MGFQAPKKVTSDFKYPSQFKFYSKSFIPFLKCDTTKESLYFKKENPFDNPHLAKYSNRRQTVLKTQR